MLINFCRSYSDLELKRDEIIDLASYVHKLSFNYLMDLDEIIDDSSELENINAVKYNELVESILVFRSLSFNEKDALFNEYDFVVQVI